MLHPEFSPPPTCLPPPIKPDPQLPPGAWMAESESVQRTESVARLLVGLGARRPTLPLRATTSMKVGASGIAR